MRKPLLQHQYLNVKLKAKRETHDWPSFRLGFKGHTSLTGKLLHVFEITWRKISLGKTRWSSGYIDWYELVAWKHRSVLLTKTNFLALKYQAWALENESSSLGLLCKRKRSLFSFSSYYFGSNNKNPIQQKPEFLLRRRSKHCFQEFPELMSSWGEPQEVFKSSRPSCENDVRAIESLFLVFVICDL